MFSTLKIGGKYRSKNDAHRKTIANASVSLSNAEIYREK
jgi:hypothetical protein